MDRGVGVRARAGIIGLRRGPRARARAARGAGDGAAARRRGESPMSIELEKVWAALQGVLDPELGMSIVELGLVYGVDVRDGTVRVTMTLTTPGCPIHEAMTRWVGDAVRRVPGVEDVAVCLTFDPPWRPERIQ